ncbi:polysaccharide biosynthesis tyrosine autokinase [bacterium]|nr:polysaccharide biosynthesis tyrosine autokinase [bacterium]
MENNEQDGIKQLSFQDYLRIVRKGKWIIIVSFISILSLTVYYSFTAKQVFQTSTKILIEDSNQGKNVNLGQLMMIPGFGKDTKINNQLEILQSHTILGLVADSLMNSPFKNQLEILGNQDNTKLKTSFLTTIIEKFKNKAKNFINRVFPKKESIDKTQESLLTKPSQSGKRRQIVEELKSSVSLKSQKESDIIEIVVRGSSPFEVTLVANTIAEKYKSNNIFYSRNEVSAVKKFIEASLQRIQTDLRNSEELLKQFKETENVIVLDKEVESLVEQLAEFEVLEINAQTSYLATQKRLDVLKSQLDKTKINLVDIMANASTPKITGLREEMIGLDKVIANYIASGIDKTHERIADLKKKRDFIRKDLITETKKFVTSELAPQDPLVYSQELVEKVLELEVLSESEKATADAFRDVVQTYSQKLQNLPEKSLQFIRLQRNTQVDEKIYLLMQEKYQEIRIQEYSQTGNVRIVEEALEPKDPVSPNKRLNILLGTIIGLVFGIGIILLLEYLDDSIKTVQDLERMNINVLGAIPIIETERKLKDARVETIMINSNVSPNKENINQTPRRVETRLITYLNPRSPISESYRIARTNLQFLIPEKGKSRAVIITSSNPGEGKSTTVANMAITNAQAGLRTLLIDTDLRRPVLHTVFGFKKDIGLTSILSGRVSLSEAVLDTGIENLHLLVSGALPPNPSELLGSARMEELIREMREKYDIVLFDSPPTIAVTDASVLGAKVDGCVIIVYSGNTTFESLKRAKQLLTKVGVNVVGSVLNNVDIRSHYGSYSYYYQYYYYYSGDKKIKDRKSQKKRSGYKYGKYGYGGYGGYGSYGSSYGGYGSSYGYDASREGDTTDEKDKKDKKS